jgi:hypothetical protein
MRRGRFAPWGVALVTCMVDAADVHAQPKAGYDEKAVVFREMIELTLPPPYLLLPWPDPPVAGYFAWKVSFGNDSTGIIVFRTDSAITARTLRDVVRRGALYSCESSHTSVMDCTTKIRGNARSGLDGLVLQITEPKLVARVRQAQAPVYLRQLFEPGGRFRVDHIGATYK